MTKGPANKIMKLKQKLINNAKRAERLTRRQAGQKTKAVKKVIKQKLRGGAVSMDFKTPDSDNASANMAIGQAMSKQKINAANMVDLNKAMAGGGGEITIPQMSQAGAGGNALMKGVLDLQLQARAASEGDAAAMIGAPKGIGGTMTGGRKSRKRRKRRNKRKTKKNTKRRRRRKRKSIKRR